MSNIYYETSNMIWYCGFPGLRYEAEHHDNQLYIVTNKGTYAYIIIYPITVVIIIKLIFNDDCYHVIIITDPYLILFPIIMYVSFMISSHSVIYSINSLLHDLFDNRFILFYWI